MEISVAGNHNRYPLRVLDIQPPKMAATTRKVTKRVSKRTIVSRAIPNAEEDITEEEGTQDELPTQPILRKTRSRRMVKPPRKKLVANACREVYS